MWKIPWRCPRRGADGLIRGEVGADGVDIVSAVRSVAAGHAVFGPNLAQRLRTWFAAPLAVARYRRG